MEVKTIAVIGAGLMGRGIAEASACAGFKVIWADVNADFVRKGLSNIAESFDRRVEKKKISPADRDRLQAQLNANVIIAETLESVQDADLAIEAITENLELKSMLHAQLGEICRHETLLASNTSTISITKLAASSKRPERFVGMHFFSPVAVMRVVEVTRGLLTSDATCQAARAVVAKLGKESVLAPDIPGFLVNRIRLAQVNEALFMAAQGVDPEEIDKGIKLATGTPMGIFEVEDYAGLDVTLAALDTIYEGTGDPKFKAHPLLRNMVQAGLLGRKTGRGFYDYSRKGI